MTNSLNESLSALMDNEADELELRRLLKEMEARAADDSDTGMDELKSTWQRYHVISAVLKQEVHTVPSRNLLAGIKEGLADEPVPVVSEIPAKPANRTGRSVLQMLGQGAIAASMALAVLFTADMVMVADNDADAGPTQVATNERLSGPPITGELNPSTETRVAIQSGLDEQDFSRLEQVVSEELQDALQRPERDAVFSPQENR